MNDHEVDTEGQDTEVQEPRTVRAVALVYQAVPETEPEAWT